MTKEMEFYNFNLFIYPSRPQKVFVVTCKKTHSYSVKTDIGKSQVEGEGNYYRFMSNFIIFKLFWFLNSPLKVSYSLTSVVILVLKELERYISLTWERNIE